MSLGKGLGPGHRANQITPSACPNRLLCTVKCWLVVMVVAQLVKGSLTIPEICGSNPVFDKKYKY